MAFKRIESISFRQTGNRNSKRGSYFFFTDLARESKGSNHSRLNMDLQEAKELRWQLGDRVAWYVDADTKQAALKRVPGDSAGAIITSSGGKKKCKNAVRIHLAREVSSILRDLWKVDSKVNGIALVKSIVVDDMLIFELKSILTKEPIVKRS
jgi:hypothetical protein